MNQKPDQKQQKDIAAAMWSEMSSWPSLEPKYKTIEEVACQVLRGLSVEQYEDALEKQKRAFYGLSVFRNSASSSEENIDNTHMGATMRAWRKTISDPLLDIFKKDSAQLDTVIVGFIIEKIMESSRFDLGYWMLSYTRLECGPALKLDFARSVSSWRHAQGHSLDDIYHQLKGCLLAHDALAICLPFTSKKEIKEITQFLNHANDLNIDTQHDVILNHAKGLGGSDPYEHSALLVAHVLKRTAYPRPMTYLPLDKISPDHLAMICKACTNSPHGPIHFVETLMNGLHKITHEHVSKVLQVLSETQKKEYIEPLGKMFIELVRSNVLYADSPLTKNMSLVADHLESQGLCPLERSVNLSSSLAEMEKILSVYQPKNTTQEKIMDMCWRVFEKQTPIISSIFLKDKLAASVSPALSKTPKKKI